MNRPFLEDEVKNLIANEGGQWIAFEELLRTLRKEWRFFLLSKATLQRALAYLVQTEGVEQKRGHISKTMHYRFR